MHDKLPRKPRIDESDGEVAYARRISSPCAYRREKSVCSETGVGRRQDDTEEHILEDECDDAAYDSQRERPQHSRAQLPQMIPERCPILQRRHAPLPL